jgi:Uma2 family endonuclease
VHAPAVGTPYFDEELQVAQSAAHRIMAVASSAILAAIADEAGLAYLSDEPIWYLHPETDEQRTYYGDCVLARSTDLTRITAEDLLLVLEVVSTNDRRRELKDTGFHRLLHQYNAVPEFALAFPELEDARALTWLRLAGGEYEERIVAPGGRVRSERVPELELEVLPRERWTPGYKIDIYYRGELRPRLVGERARAEQEKARAEQEKARAERLAERLRALGIGADD